MGLAPAGGACTTCPGTYALTYTLRQRDRVTRRLTLWQKRDGTWTILFHQGTLVAA